MRLVFDSADIRKYIIEFFAPNSLIGQENINLVCLFLKIKAISAIVLAFFMIMFMIKSAVTFFNEKGYGLGHKIVGVVFSCFVSILWMNFISVQSQYSTYGIKNLIEEISVVQKISNGSAFKKTINLTKQDDIFRFIKKNRKSLLIHHDFKVFRLLNCIIFMEFMRIQTN